MSLKKLKHFCIGSASRDVFPTRIDREITEIYGSSCLSADVKFRATADQ